MQLVLLLDAPNRSLGPEQVPMPVVVVDRARVVDDVRIRYLALMRCDVGAAVRYGLVLCTVDDHHCGAQAVDAVDFRKSCDVAE